MRSGAEKERDQRTLSAERFCVAIFSRAVCIGYVCALKSRINICINFCGVELRSSLNEFV